jgi:hypothetical protein
MKPRHIPQLAVLILGVSLCPARAGGNVLANSGFEVCTTEALPDFWGPGTMGISAPRWALDPDSWRQHWRVDSTTSHSGRRSMRIDCPGDPADLILYGRWVDLPVLNVPWTLSAWMKSDRADLPVDLTFQFGSKTVKVGPEWGRYSVTASPYDKTQTIIITPKGQGVLWVDDVQFEQADTPTDYAPAAYDAGLTGQAVHRPVPDRPPCRIRPGGTKTAAVTIDAHRRLLVDGVPFIPFTMAWGHLPNREMLQDCARAGYNAGLFLIGNDTDLAALRTCLDQANACGLKIILSMLGGITTENRTRFITAFREHPALLVWYVVDEPTGDDPAVRQAYDLAKRLDPARPAYINYAPGFYFPTVLPSDIASLDRYDIGAEPDGPIYQAQFADRLESIARPAGKPSWIVLQCSGYAFWMSREPTGPEEEALVYLTLIHGVRGLKFWVDKPLSLELWRTMKMLAGEVRQLTPVLYSLEPAPPVAAAQPEIHVLAKTWKGRTYVMAANAAATPVAARLAVAGAGRAATVLFEQRRVKLVDGVIEDTFLPYQRHVYELR